VRHETPWGTWDPLTPARMGELLAEFGVQWWICGGYAIEAFVGRAFREHEDFDFGIIRDDQLAVQRHLASWDLQAADPPGTLRPWVPGEFLGELLGEGIHTAWARRSAGEPWEFQVMFDEAVGAEWVYRRDPRVRRPLDTLTFERDGLPYLAPEVQLLYKSKGRRPKDEVDFATTTPLLSTEQREWLRAALALSDPQNPWLSRLVPVDQPRGSVPRA
jgi:hypothetical protein